MGAKVLLRNLEEFGIEYSDTIIGFSDSLLASRQLYTQAASHKLSAMLHEVGLPSARVTTPWRMRRTAGEYVDAWQRPVATDFSCAEVIGIWLPPPIPSSWSCRNPMGIAPTLPHLHYFFR